jgi:hypothetical protein
MNDTQDDLTTLKYLRAQHEFIEKGGYRDSSLASWRAPAMFLDSPICLNFDASYRSRHCPDCALMQFVPEARVWASIPCHHIPLNERGDTVESAEGWAEQSEIEDLVKSWLHRTIEQLEMKTRHVPGGTPW